jgi:hypothetical protein
VTVPRQSHEIAVAGDESAVLENLDMVSNRPVRITIVPPERLANHAEAFGYSGCKPPADSQARSLKERGSIPRPATRPSHPHGGLLLFADMPRSTVLESHMYGDPLAALERKRAEQSGKKLSKREWLEMGNRPLPEFPRRSPTSDADEWSPARKAAEALFAGDALIEPRRISAVRQAADELFDLPKP